jgi:HK97 family phage portal protein
VKVFGFSITRTKAAPNNLQDVHSQRGWWPLIRESFAGAWQRNIEITLENATSHTTVFACVTQIADDVSKMRMRLVQMDADGIWNEVEVPAFSPVLRRPNHFQSRIQFFKSWMYSKLLHGNTYVLKDRDRREVVSRMYVLDPCRVRPLVAPDSSVFYALKTDNLSGLPDEVVVPASEIIHDRTNFFFHPLVGLSPVYACGLAALQGLKIQQNSVDFFANGSQPGGILSSALAIKQETAERIKQKWDNEFTGSNRGKVAVLGDGLSYQAMTESAHDSQLVEQWKLTAENIASAFHVPLFMVGGQVPSDNNVEALMVRYYAQCIQVHAEEIELCLDEGLGLTTGENLANRYGTEFDIDDLLRMDRATMMETLDKGRNYLTPNDGRKVLNLKPKPGGDDVYRQQQDFSLTALQKRDSKPDPFAKTPTAAPTQPASPAPSADEKAWMHEVEASVFQGSAALALKHTEVVTHGN